MKKIPRHKAHCERDSAAKRITFFSVAFCLMLQCFLVTSSASADTSDRTLSVSVPETMVNESAITQPIDLPTEVLEQTDAYPSDLVSADADFSQPVDEQDFLNQYTLIFPEDMGITSPYSMRSGDTAVSFTANRATTSAIDVSNDVKYTYHFLDSVSLSKVLRSDAVKYEAENYTAIAPSEPGRKVRTVGNVDYDVIWLQGETAEAVATYEVTVDTAGTYELIISGTGIRNEETPSPRGISWWLDGGQKYQVDIEPIISTAYTYNNDPIAGFAMGYVYGITLELEAGVNVLHFGHHEEYGKLGRINFDAFYIQKAQSSYPTYADFEYVYLADSSTGKVAACAITGYTGNAANVSIPATIKGYPVIWIYSNAFANNTNIQTVQLSSNITMIASNAFAGCKNLTACYITYAPNLDAIGAYAFYGCSSLNSITLPGKTTSIGNSAFRHCSALKSVILPNSLTTIYASAFRDCTSLESITIPGSITTYGYYMFADCTSLVSAEYKYGNQITGTAAFQGCTALTDVTLPSTLKTINSFAFNKCSSLVSITIPANVTDIGDTAFQSCTSLETVEMPASLTEIKEYTFNQCKSLQSIVIPKNVTRIGYAAFNNCDSLTAVTIPASVTELADYAFLSNDRLESAYFLGDVPTTVGEWIFESAAGGFTIYFNANATGWTTPTWTTSTSTYNTASDMSDMFSYTITDGRVTITGYVGQDTELKIPESILGYPVTTIGNLAFSRCYSLTSVTIPDSVTTIGDCAFEDCRSLVSITIGNGVLSIGKHSFRWCDSLTEITIPDSVTSIDEAFLACTSMTKITVDVNNTMYKSDAYGALFTKDGTVLVQYPAGSSNIVYDVPLGVTNIYANAFYRCYSLMSVTIPDSVATIGSGAFEHCSSLVSITLPSSITHIGNRAFYACGLTSVTIPDSVATIGSGAFEHCSSLVSITLPSSITHIMNNAFYWCDSLISVVIPNSVTSISESAFAHCSSLASITLPNSVTYIGNQAFYNCSLTSITIPSSVTTLFANAFDGCPLTKIEVDVNNTVYKSDAYGALLSKDGAWLLKYPVKSNNTIYAVPSGVTNISANAFYNCSSLISVTIPDSVMDIGAAAFQYCGSLTDVYFHGDVPEVWSPEIWDKYVFPSDITIYYPEGNTSGWTSPTWTAPDGTVYNTATFKPGSSSDPTMPPSTPDFTPSVEYDEEVVAPTQFPVNQTDDYMVMVIDAVTKEPIANAAVVFGEQSVTTASDGFALFTIPDTLDSVALSITANGYNGFTIEEYSDFKQGGFDAFELYPTGYTAITPISCNNIAINTSVALINNQADLTAVIKVKGTAAEAITKYCLVQNDKTLAESATGTFSVSNKSFAKDVPVSVWMYTADGKITKQILKINVISAKFNPKINLFTNDFEITVPDDTPILGGIKFQIKLPETIWYYDVSNTSIKVGLNYEVEKKDLSKLNSGLRKNMEKIRHKTPSSSFEFDSAGYIVLSLGNSGVKDVKGEMLLVATYKNGFGKTYTFPLGALLIPIRVEVDMSAKGEITISGFGFDFENSTIVFPDTDLSVKTSFALRAGVGVSAVSAGLYGKIAAEFKFSVFPEFYLDHIYGTGDAGLYLKAKLGFIDLKVEQSLIDKSTQPWKIYSRNSAEPISLAANEFDPYDTSLYGMMARKVMSAPNSWNSSTADGVLQYNAYENADPQIIVTDGLTMMIYLDDNGSGDAYNFQRLVYSVWNGSGWNTPVPVDNNELVDADFCAYTDGTNIWIAYTQANRLFVATDKNEDYAGAMEIALVCYDFQTATFSSPSILTANDTYDMQPQITIVNDIPTVVWSNNSDNHILGMTKNNSLYISQYTQEQWCTPVCIAENVSALYDLKIGAFDSLGYVVAAIHDLDNDYNTDSDSFITLYHQDGSQYMYTAANCSNLVFNQQALYWFQNNSIYSVSNYRREAMPIYEFESASIANDFAMIYQDGLSYLFYRVYNSNGENGGSTLYAMVWDGETWTAPVELTENSGYIDSFDVQIINDFLLLVYRRTDVSFANSNLVMQCKLRSNMLAFVPSVVITDISYDSEDLFDDDKVTLTVSITNNGLRAATGIQLMDENNTSVSYAVQISSGETVNLSFDYIIPPNVQKTTLSIIDEKGVAAWRTFDIGFADFTVSANSKVIVKSSYVNISIANRGNTSSNGTINVYQENSSGKLIYSETLALDANRQKNILLEILDDTLTEVYVEFLSNTQEYNSQDNSIYCSVVHWQGATISGIVYWNDDETTATINLLQNGEKKYSANTSTNTKSGETTQFFTFSNVLPGTYTLCIEKSGYLPYTITNISVTATDNINLSQHINSAIAQIRPFYGNINHDGTIDLSDIEEIRSINNYGLETSEEGVNALCDLNNDGMCNLIDIAILRQSAGYGKTKDDCVFSYTESMVP